MKVKWAFAVMTVLWAANRSYSQQVYYMPPMCPTVRVEYILAVGQKDTYRMYKHVNYKTASSSEGRWISVPIIDGLVPDVNSYDCPDGNKKIVYDYRSRTPLEEVNYQGKPLPERLPRTYPEPPPLSKPSSVTPPSQILTNVPSVTFPRVRSKPRAAIEEHDDGWHNPRVPRMTSPPISGTELPSTSPFKSDTLPNGLRLPDYIDEPTKRIIPRYREETDAPS